MTTRPMYDLSVIVPTYNRKEYLPALLSSMAGQDYPPDRWELVIVDDGSADGTSAYLEAFTGAKPVNMRVITQANSGVAQARNNASFSCESHALLFLDDDMIASPRLVGEHARAHLADPASVVIGHLSLPSTGRDPWVAWEDRQLVKHFDALASARRTPGPRDFYSGNCSVSASLFRSVGGYDKTLPRTEDVELGYRLRDAGACFYYRPEAESLHLGKHGYAAWLRNAGLYGRCDVLLAWERGHTHLQAEIFSWYSLRHRLNRALIASAVNHPRSRKPLIAGLNVAGRASYKLGARKASGVFYSAIYNLAYWSAFSDTLGREKFWQGIAASNKPLVGGREASVEPATQPADR